MRNLKFDYKHFFTSVKPKTQKMAKTTLFSQKASSMRPYFVLIGCSMILYWLFIFKGEQGGDCNP